jgi:hypothetical protein
MQEVGRRSRPEARLHGSGRDRALVCEGDVASITARAKTEGLEMGKLSSLGCGALASLGLFAGTASADANGSPPQPQLEGAWQVVVTLRVDASDCTTATVIVDPWNPFPSFNTFHRGGTMSEFGTRSPPSTRTSGHGVWKRTGGRTYEYRSVFFSFTPDNVLAANMDVRADIKLTRNGRKFEGVSRLVRTDLAGNALHFCATLAGERITL